MSNWRSSFLAAVSNGDLQALEELLADDVVLHGDGGGRVRAITRPVHGRAKVARMLLSVDAGRRAVRRTGPSARCRSTANPAPWSPTPPAS